MCLRLYGGIKKHALSGEETGINNGSVSLDRRLSQMYVCVLYNVALHKELPGERLQ